MRVDEYTYVRKFEDLCAHLTKICEKYFGEPSKYIIDTNIYFFLFEKGTFRLCVDSSESWCFPNDPDIYFKLVYHESTGQIHMDEVPGINIRCCEVLIPKYRAKIKKASRIVGRTELTQNTINYTKAFLFYFALLIAGYSLKAYKGVSKLLKGKE